MTAIDFGELRSLVHQEPSPELFHQLLDLVEVFDEAQVAMWWPYLSQQLDQWPDVVRACPADRLKELELGSTVWTPLVRHLNYEGQHLTAARFTLLLDHTGLQHITHLNLCASRFKWEELLELAQRAPFTQLKGFAMRKSSSSGADKHAIKTLFHSPMLARLEHLSFNGWGGIKSLVLGLVEQAPFLGTLKSLDLTGCTVSPKRLRSILLKPELSGLEAFYMGGQNKNAPMGRLKVLVEAEHLTNLHTLELGHFTSDEFVEFTRATHFQSLRTLRLAMRNTLSVDDPTLDDEALVEFFTSPPCTHLHTLELSTNLLKSSTLRALASSSPLLSSLTHLTLKAPSYSKRGLTRPEGEAYVKSLDALLSSDLIGGLQTLALSGLDPDHEEFERFINSPMLCNVRKLDLGSNKLDLRHIELLLQSRQLENLRELDLHGAELDLAQFKALIFSGVMPILQRLHMRYIYKKGELSRESQQEALNEPAFPARFRHVSVLW